ncbi:hypothetical protein EMCRGX_G005543 [Ephydatia muelleri]
MQAEVTYLGYRIDQDGIHPTEEHVLAIKQMPAPSNVKELRSFLGAINYYSRFLPNLQSLCTPLHQLTKNATRWVWSKESYRVFQHLKQLLTSKDTLVHYDEALPLVLMTDASDNGVGAVLLHRLSDGVEKPVGFASRTLMDREKRYSVIDKEALAIIFGVTKFYQYLYGRRFILQTDHKPLERILGAHQEIPKMAANRLQRIHVDYAGPFEGMYWLVVIDAFSKWLEIKPMQVSTAAVTIKALRKIFCRFGLPRVIVSDNGPQFIASEFKDFCTANNITHIRATPYHPKTNRLAERAVRTFKERFSATKMHRDDLDLTLQRFLISYRNTPHKSTGRSPAELLLGRRIRTKLDLLKPDINHYMDKALTQQKVYHDTRAKFSSFTIGDLVWVGRPEGKRYESGCIMRKPDHYHTL